MENRVIKVREHFWRIENGGVRMFLFEGTDRAMLVDTGFGDMPARAVAEELTDLPFLSAKDKKVASILKFLPQF